MAQTFDFVKLHGAGNDFVFIEDMSDVLEVTPEEVVKLCDRHFGIGADGVILVKPAMNPANAGFMDYRNSDGSIAQMCGNGVRCFAKYLVDQKLVAEGAGVVNVETRAGVKPLTFTVGGDGKLVAATVDMGAPELEPARVPTALKANAETEFGAAFVKDVVVPSPNGDYAFTCVSMGNPHAVTFVEDCESLDIDRIGSYFESCDAFPEKANIEFATVTDAGIRMRVYERGCGETLACGTGACATGVAAYLTGRAPAANDLILSGGTLHIDYTPGGTVLMTGPAAESFRGTASV